MTLDWVKDDTLSIRLAGRLDLRHTETLWPRVERALRSRRPADVRIDASELTYCDSSGIALILRVRTWQARANRPFQLTGLSPTYERLMGLMDPGEPEAPAKPKPCLVRMVEDAGRAASDLGRDLRAQVGFLGEVIVKLGRGLMRPRTLRWGDFLHVSEQCGVDGLGITALLGFLIGLILAFQAAVAMKQFGAEVFVADLVVISLFRELGPLITAFILASRSGSAFAAQIGTMKINEEIDALNTLGLDPIRFLVLPRIMAGVCVLPLLTLFNLLFGLLGCAVVMRSMGYPASTFMDRIQEASGLGDLFGGLAKTLVFGLLIAGIGCLRGLQTRSDAAAVGRSATRAVVSGIVAIILADGVFAVLYYVLGI